MPKGNHNHFCRRLSGYEHLPPVSVPFRCFLSRLICWASAQRRSLGAKIPRKLPAHRCFAVAAEQIWAEARRRPQGILLYFQGLERSISPNLPAKTGRGSYPLSLALPREKHPKPSIARPRADQTRRISRAPCAISASSRLRNVSFAIAKSIPPKARLVQPSLTEREVRSMLVESCPEG